MSLIPINEQVNWCHMNVKKTEKRSFSQYKCSPSPDMKAGPGACPGLGWRKPKAQKEEKNLCPAGPMPHTTISLLFHLKLGLCLDLAQQKNDLLSGKAFLSVMLS